MRKRVPETPFSIRGIISQLRVSANSCQDGATAEMPIGLVYRLISALEEMRDMKLEAAGVEVAE